MPSPSSPAEGSRVPAGGPTLLVQTTGGPARVAWGGPGEEPTVLLGTSPRAAAAELPGLVASALEVRPPVRVGVVVGPGSFTGIKVGLAFARGLARGRGVELVGISGSAAVARAAGPGVHRVAADALRGEAAVQELRVNEDGGVELEGPATLQDWDRSGALPWIWDPDLGGGRASSLTREAVAAAAWALVAAGRGSAPRPLWTRPTWAEEGPPGSSPPGPGRGTP